MASASDGRGTGRRRRGQSRKVSAGAAELQGTDPGGPFSNPVRDSQRYGLSRAIPAGKTADDVSKAIDLVKQLRLYSFAQAANPPTQRYIDMAGKLIDGVVAFNDTFYVSLARMVEEEPVLPRDRVAMGMLRSLGIEKGKSYNPDPKVKQTLGTAAQQAHRQFMTALHGGEPWWPGTHWKLVEDKGAKAGFSFIDDNAVYLDERGLVFFMAFAAPKKLGAATFYLVRATDSTGKPLDGSRSYKLPRPGECAREAILGGNALRPRHGVPDPQHVEARTEFV